MHIVVHVIIILPVSYILYQLINIIMEKKKKEGTVKMKEREGPDKSEEI